MSAHYTIPPPDINQAQRFLTLLDEGAESFTFQTFDDSKARKDPALTRIFHGPLERYAATLAKLNRRGAGIFVTVNETDLQGRKLENIVRIRTVFLEDDGAGEPLPLEPNITVQSSPGKHHYYLLVDGISLDDAGHAMRTMVDRYGSDPSAKDITRVLRLPGFHHMKNPATPHLVKIVDESGALPYTRDQIFAGLGVNVVESKVSTPVPNLKGKPLPGAEYQQIQRALTFIPADERQVWLDIGMALHSTGAAQALELWDTWSRGSSKYNQDDAARVWSSFGRRDGVSMATVYHYAQQNGWEDPGLKSTRIRPRYATVALSVDLAKTRLDELLDNFLGNLHDEGGNARAMAIAGAAGLGKTHAALDKVAKRIAGDVLGAVEYFAPTTELVAEAITGAAARHGMDARTVRGRGRDGPMGPMCKRKPLVDSLQAHGIYSVMQKLCVDKNTKQRCPYYSGCPYMLQAEHRALKGFPHAYLPLENGIVGDSKPELIIIDEDFLKEFEGINEWSLSEVMGTGHGILDAVANAVVNGEPLLPTLRKRDDPTGEIQAALKGYERMEPAISPGMNDSAIVGALLDFEEGRKGNSNPIPYRLLTTLHTALQSGAQDTTAIWYDRHLKNYERIKAVWIKPLPARLQNVPVLLLDACINPELTRFIFPHLEYHHIPVERNARVVQITSTSASNRYLEPQAQDPRAKEAENIRQRLEARIASLEQKHGPGLVVTKKTYEGRLNLPESCATEHWGNLRGLDKHKDRNFIVTIGRNQPPPRELETRARTYYGNSEQPLKLIGQLEYRQMGYRMRDGNQIGVKVQCHVDERVQAFLELEREAETLQAVDRLRVVHNKEPKDIYIVGNLVYDITVDETCTMREFLEGGNKAEQLAKSGPVLVLNPMWLHEKFPVLFKTPDAAKHFINRELKNVPNPNIYYLLENGTFNFTLVKFRLVGQRGKMMSALTQLDDEQTKAWLEHALGNTLVAYEPVATTQEVEAAPTSQGGYPEGLVPDEPSWTFEDLAEPLMAPPLEPPPLMAEVAPEVAMDPIPDFNHTVDLTSILEPAEVRKVDPVSGRSTIFKMLVPIDADDLPEQEAVMQVFHYTCDHGGELIRGTYRGMSTLREVARDLERWHGAVLELRRPRVRENHQKVA